MEGQFTVFFFYKYNIVYVCMFRLGGGNQHDHTKPPRTVPTHQQTKRSVSLYRTTMQAHARVARLPLPFEAALPPSPGSRPCWNRAYTASKRVRSLGDMLGRAAAAADATCSAVINGAASSSCGHTRLFESNSNI